MIAKSEHKKLLFMGENLSGKDLEDFAHHVTAFLESKSDTFMILTPFDVEKISEDERLIVLKLRRL